MADVKQSTQRLTLPAGPTTLLPSNISVVNAKSVLYILFIYIIIILFIYI